MLKLIECPRDAMQGINTFIETEKKIEYINLLLKAGFDTIDAGSFVSAKAIPQMQDSAKVFESLDMSNTKSKLLAIVANERGANDAAAFSNISYLGFPFSISENFQQRNTNSSIEQSLARVAEIQNICVKHNKELVVYISMAFGNPYDEPWNADLAIHWCNKLAALGIKTLALSDTIGVSNPENINYLFSNLISALPQVEFGAHLHSTPTTASEKIAAAYQAGCRRFDSAIHGLGGCPMAKDDLTGNLATETLLSYFEQENIVTGLHTNIMDEAYRMAWSVFPTH
jgi:hydroxymethylglutaryl-CoA lyase